MQFSPKYGIIKMLKSTTENQAKKTLPAYFGKFGGMYVGELLVPALEQLEQAFIESQTDEAFLISGSEKQRMLSQNITKLAFVIRDVVDTPQRKDAIVNLSQLSSEIKSSHNSLYKLHRVSIKNKSLDSLYKLSEVYLNRITTASNNIINSSENDTIIDDVYAIANAELPYLWAMDAIVDQYQQMAESNLRSVEFDLYMFFVISILLFTSGLFYIFMPAVKKLAKKDRDLRRNKEELGISKQKIKKNLIEVRKLQSDIESKDRYNRIFIEQAPSSIAMLDKNMRYIAVSEKWKTDYKMVGKDIVGRSHYDLFPEIGEEWKKQHQKCLNGEIDICDQYPFKRADGSVQWIFWDVRPWYNANEEIGGLIMYTGDITHIKEQSQAKEKVENILESTNKVAKIGTWELDLSTDKYELSDITRKILELPKDYEVYGKESLKFYKEGESRNKITECLNHLITTGEPFDIEVEFKTYKGNSKWIRDIGQAEFIAGKCVRIFGIYQDITHIKESENSLIRQNQILNFAEEITMMGNWRWEVTDDVITWSKNLYHIFGLDESKTDLSYETYFNFVHPDDKDKVTNYREKSIEEKKFHENFIHKIITSDGKIKTVHLLGEVITNNDGEVIELIGTCQDITHQRIAEIKFRGLLESAPDAMVIVDEEAKIHLINKQAERIFGYSPSEILGKPVEVLVPNHILENFITYRKRFFNNPKAVTMGENKEFVGVNKNGEEFPAQISLSPLETEDGLLVSAAIRDISIEKQAAQKIINANENLELLAKKLTAQNTQLADFAHITSHNLRAPVSNLHSLLDLCLLYTSDAADE